MSKLSKFYVSQSTRPHHSESDSSLKPAQHSVNGHSEFPSSNGHHVSETMERIPTDEETVLVDFKAVAYYPPTEAKDTLQSSPQRQQHALQEINHLRDNLAELRRQFILHPGNISSALEQPLSNLEYHLGILARTFTE